jgi:hypothetical protein
MDYSEFKEKYPIGTIFKCLKVPPLSPEDALWNHMVDQQLNFEIVGHVLKSQLNGMDQFTIIIKIVSYDPMNCKLSQEYLQDTHFFYVKKVRTNYLEILNKPVVINNQLDKYPHACPRCGAPAYIGLFSTDCSKGC